MQPASIFRKHSVPEVPPLKEAKLKFSQDGEAGTRSKEGSEDGRFKGPQGKADARLQECLAPYGQY